MKTAKRILFGILGVILVLLLLIRFVGSPIVTARVNRKLEALPRFRGHVEAVHLSLWRGTVGARNFSLESREANGNGPVVRIRHASLSIAWLPLLKGKLGGHGEIEGADVVMLKLAPASDEKDKEKKAAPPIREWQNVLREAFPMEVTRFEIKDSQLKFEDRSAQPAAVMVVDQIHLVATDISNRPKAGEMPARMQLDARVGGSGQLKVDVRADPSAAQPRFNAKMELVQLSLPEIHDFLLAYALIDVSAGTFEVFSEVEGLKGGYHGFIKPFFRDLKFKAVPDPEKNMLQRTATKLASAVTELLKNDEGAVATKAPFSGNFENNDVDVWTTIENLLRNAFVQGLRVGLEGADNAK